ncbi:hypothetical protein CHS0354_029901 [Potamilus streckersoni]|uniref:Uncharacterized protein n=1 Tax=Potamilus streckersoni TaxID=2493646 RepID=A0AAE0VIE6_9BIVA|nr:hypothetical protein CHS0354_029901 [Potamilus streckersoni]
MQNFNAQIHGSKKNLHCITWLYQIQFIMRYKLGPGQYLESIFVSVILFSSSILLFTLIFLCKLCLLLLLNDIKNLPIEDRSHVQASDTKFQEKASSDSLI